MTHSVAVGDMVEEEWDRLYQSPRRPEIVATLMLLYEAHVGQALPLEFEASMKLTMQGGARMRTWCDEKAGRIRLTALDSSMKDGGALRQVHQGGHEERRIR